MRRSSPRRAAPASAEAERERPEEQRVERAARGWRPSQPRASATRGTPIPSGAYGRSRPPRARRPPVRGSSSRQLDDDPAAVPGRLVDADRAAVEVDDPAGDREPETAAAVVRRRARGRSVEALEDALGLVRRGSRGPRPRPRGATCRSAEPARRSTVPPSGEWRIAFATRLSSDLPQPLLVAVEASAGLADSTASATRRSAARGRQLVGDLLERARRTSTLGARAGPRPTRASRGRGAARRAGRAARPAEQVLERGRSAASTPSTRFSSCARSAPIGVRSSWDAFATRSRRRRSTCSSSAAIELNARASSPTSSREVAVTRRL